MNDELGGVVSISGKHCESGDVLIRDVHLPDDVTPGDLLCIPATGAYTYSMANNYNHVPRPPVVMVSEGQATPIIRRETYDDLLRNDITVQG
jgi:diaminopimelate decarboxylase